MKHISFLLFLTLIQVDFKDMLKLNRAPKRSKRLLIDKSNLRQVKSYASIRQIYIIFKQHKI